MLSGCMANLTPSHPKPAPLQPGHAKVNHEKCIVRDSQKNRYVIKGVKSCHRALKACQKWNRQHNGQGGCRIVKMKK